MNRSVVVYGPQRCGKTRNAEALRRHFGLNRVVDDWDGISDVPAAGALILTNVIPTRSRQTIPFAKACALARIEAKP